MAPTAETLAPLEELRRIHADARTIFRHTPLFSLKSVAERCGGDVVIKAENLQRTGSFKLRASSRSSPPSTTTGRRRRQRRQPRPGARVCGAHPRHAVPRPYAVHRGDLQGRGCRGVRRPCDPGRRLGRRLRRARTAHAEEHGWAFVHPFDDEDIVRGQAGLGLELLDDIPDLAQVIVPIGGGGLASGVALAVKLARPDVRITGVQAAACAPFVSSLRERRPVPVSAAATIADGIAIKRPGTSPWA